VLPRTSLETQLAQIFGRVLGIKTVGVLDNFFDMGGASLQSMEILALAEQAGLPVTLDLLFEHQTVAGVAEAIQRESRGLAQ
jgi:Phosphopantetheine attachment site